jgi:hypothetical protein
MEASMLERDIQRQILDWLKAEGIWHRRVSVTPVKINGGQKRNPMKGFPDMFGVLPGGLGRMFVIEVKTAKGRLSEEQQQCRRELEAKGVVYVLARSLDDAKAVVGSPWP